jgi:hypothetical protein
LLFAIYLWRHAHLNQQQCYRDGWMHILFMTTLSVHLSTSHLMYGSRRQVGKIAGYYRAVPLSTSVKYSPLASHLLFFTSPIVFLLRLSCDRGGGLFHDHRARGYLCLRALLDQKPSPHLMAQPDQVSKTSCLTKPKTKCSAPNNSLIIFTIINRSEKYLDLARAQRFISTHKQLSKWTLQARKVLLSRYSG